MGILTDKEKRNLSNIAKRRRQIVNGTRAEQERKNKLAKDKRKRRVAHLASREMISGNNEENSGG